MAKSKASLEPRIDLLVQLLDQAYDRHAWHGTNLRGSIRGLGIEEATWRPRKNRHSIWEVVIHCAYWKYIVWRKVSGETDTSFLRKGSNWFPVPQPANEANWKRDVALLKFYHERLLEAVTAFPDKELLTRPPRMERTYAQYIYGAASHDLYHAGQIQLLKRLFRTRGD